MATSEHLFVSFRIPFISTTSVNQNYDKNSCLNRGALNNIRISHELHYLVKILFFLSQSIFSNPHFTGHSLVVLVSSFLT
jgi:hypothetical protein